MANTNELPTPDSSTSAEGGPKMLQQPKKPSLASRVWKWLDLDVITVILMAKGAIPPTIALAMYQAKPVAAVYGQFGYLLAIASFLGFAILPRAKFFMNLTAHLLSLSVVAAFSMLGLWSATQARKHTTAPGQPLSAYNSSAMAVCGVWLFFLLYLINSVRSAKPALMIPSIMASVFTMVAFTTGANLATPAAARTFVRELVYTFLSGFAIATAVSLLIVPMNARLPVFKQMAGFLNLNKKLLGTVAAYLRSLENGLGKCPGPQRAALRSITIALKMLHGKTVGDVVAAKREIAYGKLDGADITGLFKLLRKLIPALMGLASIADVVDNMSHAHDIGSNESIDESGSSYPTSSNSPQVTPSVGKEPAVGEGCASIAGRMSGGAIVSIELMIDAIDHVLLTLQWSKPSKSKPGNGDSDVEAKGQAVQAGDRGFTAYFEQRANDLYGARRAMLHRHYQKDFDLPTSASLEQPLVNYGRAPTQDVGGEAKKQYQLVFILYSFFANWARHQLESFLDATNLALLDLLRFVDSKSEDGTLQKSRFIFPGKKHLRAWFTHSFTTIGHTDNEMTFGEIQPDLSLQACQVDRRNPERLPPASTWQRVGDEIAGIPRLIRSPHSAFGFRAACATLTIAIISYLHASHTFATRERFLWAEIMIGISMVRLAGMSLFQLMLRVMGTLVATIGCYVVWYIVDERIPGIIVFTYFWLTLPFYVVFKKPQFIIAGIITAITTLLIVGYELQVRRIGVRAVEASGQPFYPLYILAAYRLAIVLVGLLVAFFWTIFPYPISEHSEIRQDLSAAMYLLSNHYVITREIVHVGLATHVDEDPKTTLHHSLEKARFKFWTQESQLLGRTRMNLSMQPWQFSFGSKFPKDKYETLTALTEKILNCSALLAHAARSLKLDAADEELRALVESVPMTSPRFASRMCLLSSCLANGNPLPPGLEPMVKDDIAMKIEVADTLTLETAGKHGYAAVVVLQVTTRNILRDVDELTG